MNEQLIGLYEIAEIAGVSTAAVTNWRKRYQDFPKPTTELKSGPIFNEWEIVLWLRQRGNSIIENLNKKSIDNMFKKVVVIGRARVGKSRLLSRFIRFKGLYFKYFTGAGQDFTKINIKLKVLRTCSVNGSYIRFYSPNATLNGIYEMFDDEGVAKLLKNIEDNNTYSKNHENAGQKKELDPDVDYIEIVTEASEFAEGIMSENDDGIIVTDTPGVSGDVEGLWNVSDADLYIFVMRPDNGKEFAEAIYKMIEVIAGSKTMFVYNMGANVEDKVDYMDMKKNAIKAMEEFAQTLSKLSTGSIIRDSIEVMNPTSSVIPMGSFHDRKENFAEEIFNEELGEMLRKLIAENPYAILENDIIASFNDSDVDNDKMTDFFIKTLTTFTPRIEFDGQNFKHKFLEQRHDRVKFNDENVTLDLVNKNRYSLLVDMFKCFDKLKGDDSSKLHPVIQQQIIKYCYKKLTLSIKYDCGVSKGEHPFESQPPVTMWAEEAIIADELLDEEEVLNTSGYCRIMRKNGYTSKSWNYVRVPAMPYTDEHKYCNLKLEVIKSCKLSKYNSTNAKELINNLYNLALFRLGQYSICDFINTHTSRGQDTLEWFASIVNK